MLGRGKKGFYTVKSSLSLLPTVFNRGKRTTSERGMDSDRERPVLGEAHTEHIANLWPTCY